jgi:hypothetical protein
MPDGGEFVEGHSSILSVLRLNLGEQCYLHF